MNPLRVFTAPIRFFRYIEQPGREMQARYEAMTAEQKAAAREWSGKLNWFYATFPSPFPDRKRGKGGRLDRRRQDGGGY